MKTDFYFPSAGAGTIHGCRWTPEGEVKAIVQIVHGISDYVLRYEELARFLASQGILVVAEDHMGHGQSIGGDGKPGYFSGGWFAAVEDSVHLLRETMAEFPGVPYILYGHSMGSFLARTILCKYPDSGISAAVLSGTGWQPGIMIGFGWLISTIVSRLRGEERPSRLLKTLCFGTYNARIKSPKTESDWISRDSSIVAAGAADPLSGRLIPSAGLMRDMMVGISYIQKREHLAQMKKDLPVLFIAGDADPVGNYGKGVEQTAKVFRAAGLTDISVKIYPDCRHELHNELNRQEVFSDLLQWMKNISASL
jgi:alpha-beta hydrolase superfamily lysophospholipase